MKLLQYYFVQSIRKPLGVISVLMFGGGCIMGARIVFDFYLRERTTSEEKITDLSSVDNSNAKSLLGDTTYLPVVEGADGGSSDLDADGLM